MTRTLLFIVIVCRCAAQLQAHFEDIVLCCVVSHPVPATVIAFANVSQDIINALINWLIGRL